MKNLYVVRHAKAEGQPFDAKLTEAGREQAEALVDLFKGIPVERILTSPFIRAVETIRPLAKKKGLDLETDDRLKERVLAGQSFEDWKEKLQESFSDFDLLFEGGESNRSGLSRVESLLNDVEKMAETNIVLVSHGNLSTLILHFFDKNYGYEHLLEMTNPDVFHITWNFGNDATIKRIWTK